MNHARLSTSPRMQKLLAFLRGRGKQGATSLEIAQEVPTVAPATEVSALRHNGYTVEQGYEGRTASGAKLHRYRLIERGQRDLFA